MKVSSSLLFLFFIFCLISTINEELIINNPYLSNKSFNPPINNQIIILSNSNITKYQKIYSISSYQTQFSESNVGRGINDSIEGSSSLSDQPNFIILKHYDKLYYNSFALSPDFFAFIDDSNNKYFYFRKLY